MTIFRRPLDHVRHASARRALVTFGLTALAVIAAVGGVDATEAARDDRHAAAGKRSTIDAADPAVRERLRRQATGSSATTGEGWGDGFETPDAPTPAGPPVAAPPLDRDALRAAAQRQEERAAARRAPAAAADRERSRTAHQELVPAAALELARASFPTFVDAEPWRPLELASGERVTTFLDSFTALVKSADPTDDEPALVESSLPLRSAIETGEPTLVDLTLARDADGFEPRNPLVPTEIATDVRAGATLADGRIRVQAGASSGVPEAVGGKVFYPSLDGAALDTDLIVAPEPLGVQFAWVLRSQRSPERLTLDFDLRDGAELKRDGALGAAIVRDGKRIAAVSPPLVTDADGEPVPATYDVEGSTLGVRIAHRGGDWRYPLLVDPIVDTALLDGSGNTLCDDAPGWDPDAGSGNFGNVLDCEGGVGGIYLYHHGDTDYDPGDRTGAVFEAYRKSFIEKWDVYASHAPTGVPGTCLGQGIDDPATSTWNSGAWTHPAGLNPPTGTTPWLVAQGSSGAANYRGDPCATLSRHLKTHVPTTPTRGNRVRFDFVSLDGVTSKGSNQAYGLMSGSRVYQSDYDTPTVKLTHSGLPTGWVHDDEAAVKIEAAEPDPGLGISSLQALIPKVGGDYGGTHQTEADVVDCTGGVDDRCPASYYNSLTYDTTAAPEGRLTNYATAYDILGKAPALASWETKVDRSPPTLDFRGSEIHQGGQTLNEPSYDLKIKATDGSRATPAQERSGVHEIQVWDRHESNTINGDTERGRIVYPPGAPDDGFERVDDIDPTTCTHPQGSCEREETFEFPTNDIPPGEHTIRVVVTDQVADGGEPGWEQPDHAVYRDFTIFVPDSDDEPDADRLGLENWWTYDTTETGADTSANVNLANGNLVWHSTPVFNVGRGLSTLVNLTYNSQQRVQLPLLETPVEQLYQPYDEVGRGFSLGISGMTRLNERMNVDLAPSGRVTLTDADGTRHLFEAESSGSDVFTPPSGVQLHMRRFSKSLGFIDAPVFGFEQLETPAKAWAATRPDGVTYYFDQLGYQTSVEDRNGNAITFAYEYRGPTKDACAALNSPTNLNIFYLPGKLCQKKAVSVADAGGRALSITYESRTLAGIAPELVPEGGLPPALVGQTAETAAYASGRVKSITDHGGRVLELAYDGAGNLASMTQAKGTGAQRQLQLGYEAPQSGLTIRPLTTITDPRGNVTTVAYEPRSSGGDSLTDELLFDREVISVQDRADADFGANVKTLIDVDEGDCDTTVTDARGKVTAFKLDERGRVSQSTDPLGTKTKLAWDDATTDDNNVVKVTEAATTADEAVTDLTYNANGLLLTQKDAQAQVDSGRGSTVLTYANGPGHSSHQSPRLSGGVSIDAGRTFVSDLATATDPRGTARTFTYSGDGRGNLIERSDPEGFDPAKMTYGTFGVLTSEKDESGSEWKYSDHDASGLPKTVEDPRGKAWRYDYDALGNTTCAADPRAAGSTCSSTPGLANTTRLAYDPLDRLTQEVVPKDGTFFITRSRTYDANGNLATEVDGNVQTTTYAWTKMDAIQGVKSPSTSHAVGGTAQENTLWGYDAEENATVVTPPKGTATGTVDDFSTATTFDDVNRPVVVTRRSRGTVVKDLVTSYAYDRRDNVVGMVDPLRNDRFSGSTPQTNAATPTRRRFTFEYDKVSNRIAQVEDPGGQADRSQYAYDPNDNLVSIVDPRGFKSGATASQYTTAFAYDKRNHLIDITDAKGQRTHFKLRGDGLVSEMVAPRGIAEGGNGSAYFKTTFAYFATKELKERTLPKAPDQYAFPSATPKVQYELNDVGDPVKITDARGNSFTNTFFETGELKSTGRPSWWLANPELDAPSGAPSAPASGPDPVGSVPVPSPNLSGPAGAGTDLRERSDAERLSDDGGAGGLPRTKGFGDFGGVEPEAPPTLLQRAGSTSFDYDGEMRLRNVKDALGHDTEIEYDPVGRVTQVKRPLEESTSRYVRRDYGYDFNGNLAKVTRVAAWQKPADLVEEDPEHEEVGPLVTDVSFDQFDRRSQLDEPGDKTGTRELTLLGYDVNDRLVSRQTPRGASFTWTYGYDDLDRMTSEKNPASETTSFAYDPAGNRTQVTTPRGKVWDPEYNALNELVSVKDPAGKSTTYEYDENGNQTRVERPGAASESGGTVNTQVIRRNYDGRDLPWWRIAGEGAHARITVTEHDENGNLRRTVNPAGVDGPTRLPLEAWNGGTVTTSSTAANNATVRRYDSDDVLTAIHLPYGDIDGAGPAPEEAKRWRMDFKPGLLGRVRFVNSPYAWAGTCTTASATNDACPSQTEYERYDGGWVKSVSKPKVVAQDTFDAHTATELVFDYDRRGHQTLWRSPVGGADRRIIEHVYDPNGTLVKRIANQTDDVVLRTYSYGYNENHSLTRFKDEELGRETVMGYDAAERLTMTDEKWGESETPPKSRDTLIRYDADGNVAHRLTDGQADGNVVANYSGGKTTSFVYDDLGRETSMWVCASGGVSCDPGGGATPTRTTTSTYWDSSQVKARTKPNGVVESTYFYNDGRLAQMVRKKASDTRKNQEYVYDNNGNRAKDERGTHRFNVRNQLRRWVRAEAAGSKKPAGSEVTYEVNGAVAILKREFREDPNQSVADRTEDYVYNGDRLTEVTADTPTTSPTTARYCYDPTGFGEVRRIEDAGSCPGNLDAAISGQDTIYRYDDLSRLINARGAGQEDDLKYTYDALDRRDRRKETIGGTEKSFEFFYVGLSESLSAEQDEGGKVKSKAYDYDAHLQRQGQQTKTSSATKYRTYAHDANGSVEGLEDADGKVEDCTGGSPPPGCKSDRYRYEPYGDIEGAEGDLSDEAKENPFRFQGFYYDSSVGVYDMQARPYQPSVGRFLTEDHFQSANADLALLADPMTNNRYVFAGGNPVDGIEFDGHRAPTGGTDSTSKAQAVYGNKVIQNPGYSQQAADEQRASRDAYLGDTSQPEFNQTLPADPSDVVTAPVPAPDAGRAGRKTVSRGTTLNSNFNPVRAGGAIPPCGPGIPCIETQTGTRPDLAVELLSFVIGPGKLTLSVKGAVRGGGRLSSTLGRFFGRRSVGVGSGRQLPPVRGGAFGTSALEVLRPGGQVLGQPGTRAGIRRVDNETELDEIFERLRAVGSPTKRSYAGTGYDLPGGGFVGSRISKRYGRTLDLDIAEVPEVTKIHVGGL